MEQLAENKYQKSSKLVINLISVIVPVVVAIFLAFPNKLDLGPWTKKLPHIIGTVNTLTSIALILGWIFIKNNKVNLHRLAMLTAFALGGVFLVCYVTYHISNPSNRFTGVGLVRGVYLFILVTHILLSLVVLPFVLRAMFYAINREFENHRKIAKLAYPIWLYVSITGVIVYLMLYQLFPAV
jgi:putative membrane protein